MFPFIESHLTTVSIGQLINFFQKRDIQICLDPDKRNLVSDLQDFPGIKLLEKLGSGWFHKCTMCTVTLTDITGHTIGTWHCTIWIEEHSQMLNSATPGRCVSTYKSDLTTHYWFKRQNCITNYLYSFNQCLISPNNPFTWSASQSPLLSDCYLNFVRSYVIFGESIVPGTLSSQSWPGDDISFYTGSLRT